MSSGGDELALGVPHVRSLWARILSGRDKPSPPDPAVWAADRLVIDALGLGLHKTLSFLNEQMPDLPAFEAWILERNGGAIDPARAAWINASVDRALGRNATPVPPPDEAAAEDVLSSQDLGFWDEHGYVVLHDAVPPAACRAAEQAIWDFAGMNPADPATWYGGKFEQGIMVPLVHHPSFAANRRSPRIHRAFAQLLGMSDLVVTADRGGFNPPERPGWQFTAAGLHWDTSLVPPIPLSTQGVLYLTDTAADQGAFRCVPGFHRKLETWLAGLPPGANPRAQNLDALGPVPIAGRAGDLVIWNDSLPHGASSNRATKPRIVQYIAMYPAGRADARPWV